jgi:hypothetical protein
MIGKKTQRSDFTMRPKWAKHADVLSERLDSDMGTIATWRTPNLHLSNHLQRSKSQLSYRCMLQPDSKLRIAWGLLSFCLLTYDLVTVPIDMCFEMGQGPITVALALIARFFWVLDIPITFRSGVFKEGKIITHPREVAHGYFRSWFAFDFCLVTAELVTWMMAQIAEDAQASGSSPASLVRMLRWSRIGRFLRLLRLIRFAKIRPYLCMVMSLSSMTLGSMFRLLKVSAMMVIGLHGTACLWHLIGDNLDDGWVKQSGLEDASVKFRYSISLHFLFVHVPNGSIQVATWNEYLFDACVCFMSFIFASYYISANTTLMLTSASCDVSQLRAISRRYVKRHHLPYSTAFRVDRCLAAGQIGGPMEVLKEETRLMTALPGRLAIELQYATRVHFVKNLTLFADMLSRTPRVVRTLTNHMNLIVAVASESFFSKGDICNGCSFITDGTFRYNCDEEILSSTPRPEARPRRWTPWEGVDCLEEGDIVSEAVLWTTWEHLGDMISGADSLVVYMDTTIFTQEILTHRRATVHAVKYARHFIWHMNRSEPSDVMGFDLDLCVLDTDLYIGGAEDHFAFVSHYKVEAGTEATLMRSELETLIHKDSQNSARDFKSPVFVDTEDLVDLKRLMNHVQGSFAFILLLTPKILSRPWCLLEIVIARRNSRPIVPVLLVRAGPKFEFEFNDKDFFERLHNDQIISGGAEGRKLLESNGIQLEEVADAIRATSQQIALPFSPHGTEQVRKAEMKDILKRCLQVTQVALSEHEDQPLSRSVSRRGSAMNQ